MRVLLLDADAGFAAFLAALLSRLGHSVQREVEESAPPDAVIVGLPARFDIAREKLQGAPLLLLVDGALPFGELEAWIAGRARWALLSKPVREGALARALERITRPARPLPARPRSGPPPRA